MYLIECTLYGASRGIPDEVLYYTRRNGRHDIGPRIAAHVFVDGAVAHLQAADLRNGYWNAGMTLRVVSADGRDRHVAGQSHSD